MRLRTLDLIRYGRFTDRTLDFGPAGDGPDVAVVYGPNEAGKSTALHAWLDLLFEMPLQHRYAFQHARKDMLIGATLETADGPLTLRRTGQRTGSLTDARGRTVDERRLEVLLHGLDRDAYRTRFSLDDRVLREGGEEIAKAQGDLGQLLYAGSSGLSGFAETLRQAQEEIDGFHKPRGRSTVLAEARNTLREIEDRLDAARLDPRRFDALQAEAAAADAALAGAGAERDHAKRALRLREAADARRDLSREIDALTDRLADHPDGPDLPPEAAARLAQAIEALTVAREGRARADEALADAERRRADQTPDPDGLRIGALLAELEDVPFGDGQTLVMRATAADADLGNRRAERDRLRTSVRMLAERLAGPEADPAHVVLARDVMSAIRDAALDLRAARAGRDEARRTLAAARDGLGPSEVMADGSEALADALAALDSLRLDPEALAATARDAALAADLAAAGLPSGWDALTEAGLPTAAELRAAEQAVQAAAAEVAKADGAAADAAEALAAQTAALEAETGLADVVTDADIAASRAARDRLWSTHRGALDAASADAFAEAMAQDDAARDRHGASREARAHRARMEAEVHLLRERLARRTDAAQAARAAQETPLGAAAQFAGRLGLDPSVSPAVFAERREALIAAAGARLAAEAAQADHARALDARNAALRAVADAVRAIGGTVSAIPDGLPAARRLRSDLDERRARIASRQEAAGVVRKLEAAEARCAAAVTDAEAALTRLTAGLWCAGLSGEALLRLLDDLADLGEQHAALGELERRVAQMQDALDAFDTRAGDLIAALGDEARGASVAGLLRAARDRAAAAGAADRAIAAAQRDAAAAREEQKRLDRKIAAAIDRRDAVFAGQDSVPGEDPEAALARLVARDELRAQIASLSKERTALAEGHDPAALAEEEAQDDPVRTEALTDTVKEAEAARDHALGRRAEARAALDVALNGEGGVDPAQERAAVLEELREAARRAALTRIGLVAAAGALRRLREDRRGPMLQATEAAFRQMTGGEWPRLEAQPTGSGERLVGIRNGAAVPADAMSTGTRGQLYLALRVAGHADFTDRFGPLPFLTDDILETFDDDRAAAALRLAAEMGRMGQAILFTHHRHLVQMAEDEIPGLRVIDLQAN
jgi:uncharacterized protein YhaN